MPDNSRVMIGQRNRGAVISSSRHELLQPHAVYIGPGLHEPQHRSRAMNEQSAQVGVTAPADVTQARLAAGRILPRHEAQPGSQMPAVAELSGVADCCDDGRRGNRADSGYLGDLAAECRLLHERVDGYLEEVDALFDRAQVLQGVRSAASDKTG